MEEKGILELLNINMADKTSNWRPYIGLCANGI